MKKKIFTITMIICFFISFSVYAADYRAFYSKSIAKNEVRFIFLEASGVIVHTSMGTVLIDPATYLSEADIAELKKGGLDLILFTHEHYDHYSLSDTKKIVDAIDAPIIAEAKVATNIKDKIPDAKVKTGKPGKIYTFGDITITAIEGIHVGQIVLYHIKIGDTTIFHGGDSDYVPLKRYASDIAFVPTGSPSPTCSPEKAFKMVKDIKPKVAVAVHGAGYQHKDFEKKMKEKMVGKKVIIPEKGIVIVVKVGK